MCETKETRKSFAAVHTKLPFFIEPLGDQALVIDWGGGIERETHRSIRAFCTGLEKRKLPEMIEIIPAYTTVTVIYDPLKILSLYARASLHQNPEHAFISPFEYIKMILEELFASLEAQDDEKQSVIDIPVCYGGKHGPDLDSVAAHAGLSVEEVIHLHTKQDYLVHMVGFAPGFPYLGGMSERLEVPRRSTPRVSIAPGSVGIGGKQTGIYPISTPGGWNLIGRTPRRLFRPECQTPSLIQMGNIVRFRSITAEEYSEWKEEEL